MKKRMLTLSLLFALSCGVILGGCGKRSDEVNTFSGLSAETEVEVTSTADAAATLDSTWYDYDGNYLTGFTVTIKSGSDVIISLEVDENGQLPEFSVPTNVDLTATIVNAAGAELASSKLRFSVSAEYTQMLIMPIEDGLTEVRLPSGETSINISLFANKNGEVACSSSSRNRSTASASSTDENAEGSEDTSAEEETSAESEESSEAEGSEGDTSDSESAE